MNQRQANIEMLRIISMFFIVVGHSLCHSIIAGKVFPHQSFVHLSIQYLSMLTSTAVNCYILISGYFLVTSKRIKWSKLIGLWLQVFFYSVFFYVLHLFVNTSDVFSFKALFKVSMPIMFNTQNNCYWFVAQYFGLYVIHPFINKMLLSLTKTQHKVLLFILTVMFCLYGNVFYSQRGFSLSWFIYLYILAAYMRCYGISLLSKYSNIKLYFLLPIIPLVWGLFVNIGNLPLAGHYDNIYCLLMSLVLFQAFVNIRLFSDMINKIILRVSPFVLGVYLIHDNCFVRELLWKFLDFWVESPWIIPIILFYSSVILFFSVIIDCLRKYMFAYLCVDRLSVIIKKIFAKCIK